MGRRQGLKGYTYYNTLCIISSLRVYQYFLISCENPINIYQSIIFVEALLSWYRKKTKKNCYSTMKIYKKMRRVVL